MSKKNAARVGKIVPIEKRNADYFLFLTDEEHDLLESGSVEWPPDWFVKAGTHRLVIADDGGTVLVLPEDAWRTCDHIVQLRRLP